MSELSKIDINDVEYDLKDVKAREDANKAYVKPNSGIPLSDIDPSNIDDSPVHGSSNLVKSGGIQNEFALGVVYDVSAKNPTAGPNNDGKFESLSALLSNANLNTLIPTAYRKGGMSIKFVQSSDNKYVQYFCNSKTFTTDVTAWEKMNLEEEIGKVYTQTWRTSSGHSLYDNRINPSPVFKSGSNISVVVFGEDGLDVEAYVRYVGETTFTKIASSKTNTSISFIADNDINSLGMYVSAPSGESDFTFYAGLNIMQFYQRVMALEDSCKKFGYQGRSQWTTNTSHSSTQNQILLPIIIGQRVTFMVNGESDLKIELMGFNGSNATKLLTGITNTLYTLISDGNFDRIGVYVDAPSESTQFTFVAANGIAADDMAIGLLGRKEQTQWITSESHSSVNDKVFIPISKGGEYSFIVDGADNLVVELWGVYEGSNDAVKITTGITNTQYRMIADDNIISLGVFVSAPSVSTKFQFIVASGLSSDEAVNKDNQSVINTVKRLYSNNWSIGTSHSATANQLTIDIKQGETFNVQVVGEDNLYMEIYAKYVDDNNLAFLASCKCGDILSFMAEKDIEKIGIYHNAPSSNMLFICKVITGLLTSRDFLDMCVTNISNGSGRLQKEEEFLLQSGVFPYYNNLTTHEAPPLCLMHFSDIHGSKSAMRKVLAYKDENADFFDDVICTGDLLEDSFVYRGSLGFWLGNTDIMICLGNHDCVATVGGGGMPYVDQKDVYNFFLAPRIANWGVVQPNNAATEGLCYYYKDYQEKGYRLISVDCNYFDSAEITWLANTLESARLAGLEVIIMLHCPILDANKVDCNFSSLRPLDYGDEDKYYYWSYMRQMMDAVDTFVDNGGVFVAYLTGHVHTNYILEYIGEHSTQPCITVPCTGLNGYKWADMERVEGEYSEFAWNITSFDRKEKVLRLFRVGADRDRHLRHQGVFVYDYGNHTVLWQE